MPNWLVTSRAGRQVAVDRAQAAGMGGAANAARLLYGDEFRGASVLPAPSGGPLGGASALGVDGSGRPLLIPEGSLRGSEAPYIGNVATRGCTSDRVAGAGNLQAMTRVIMLTRDRAEAPRPVFPTNWYVDQTTNVETVVAGAVQIKASIEYPVGGARVPLYFGGIRTATFQGGDVAVPDAPDLAIPAHSAFAVNFWIASSASPFAYAGVGVWRHVAGEGCQFGATTPDLVDSGTPAYTNGALSLPILGVLAETSRRSFLVLGDSIARGYLDGAAAYTDPYGDAGAARMVGHRRAYCNAATASTRASAFTGASAPRRIALGACHSDVLMTYGTNDLGVPQTAAQVAASLAAVVALLPGRRVYTCTVPPRTTGTWAGYQGEGQTPLGTESARVALNGLVRAGIAGAAGYVDLADAVELARDVGLWRARATADGIHPNDYGHSLAAGAYGVGALLA